MPEPATFTISQSPSAIAAPSAAERYLSVPGAAARANVHPQTVRRAIASGELRVVGRAGRRWRLRAADVDAWLLAGAR